MSQGVTLKGIAASPGLIKGTAVVIAAQEMENAGRKITPDETEKEIARFRTAKIQGAKELVTLHADVESRLGKDKAAIFEAQRMILEDPGLEEAVLNKIKTDLVSAEKACYAACREQAEVFENMEDEYFAARAADMLDIGKRVIKGLAGEKNHHSPGELPDNAVVVAVDLAPSDTATLDVEKVAGMVLDGGGRTSHTAILSRSLGIPAVVGTRRATSLIDNGDIVVVDGEEGHIIVNPTEEESAVFEDKIKEYILEKESLERLHDLPAETKDGRHIELAVNIGSATDIPHVIKAGAEGVGLFRTEFLFIDRDTMPSEEEQYQAYKKVLSGLAPFPVVVRTLDIGGDKEIPYLNMPKEENPFLGLRAVRLCLSEIEMFKTQLRALLRASGYGNLKIMFPMISNISELRQVKAVLQSVKEELSTEGVEVSSHIEVGIMVEIPSAAIDACILAPECDFFSIGTNDLVQYTMAADRGNPAVAHLGDPFYPAVLKLIAKTVEAGHDNGIWVGMCGEMAGMPPAVPLLVGMGLDELSMSAGSVPKAKSIVRSISNGYAKEIWNSVKTMAGSDEIKEFLGEKLKEIESF